MTTLGTAQTIRGDAFNLPLADNTVDLICTSPPFYRLRSYTDGDAHYTGQLGDEPTVALYLDRLLAATREAVRVLKPTGSLWLNLGDRYSPTTKSLMLIPQRFSTRCTDELGLVARAEVVWDKPNPIPESAADRVRRSHEHWFHLVTSRRYYADQTDLKEPYTSLDDVRRRTDLHNKGGRSDVYDRASSSARSRLAMYADGRIPGSVWRIPAEPLNLPDHLGVKHYASFPTEWPRRIITGWCPPGGVVLDPFGGTGTTALAAKVLGRHGITVELSADYCRAAAWRVTDLDQLAKVAGVKRSDVARDADRLDMDSLF